MNSLFVKRETTEGLPTIAEQESLLPLPMTEISKTAFTLTGRKIASVNFRYECPCCNSILVGKVEIDLSD